MRPAAVEPPSEGLPDGSENYACRRRYEPAQRQGSMDGMLAHMSNRLSPMRTALDPEGRGTFTHALSRFQRNVARRMAAAKADVPEFVTEVEVDMGAVADLRSKLKRDGAVAPSYNDYVVKAVAVALRRVPRMNSSFTEEGFQLHGRVNVGVAVAAEDKLFVPTVFDADRKSVDEISREIRLLATKAREGSIRAEELADQTFTVSNLGMHGVQRFTAIINPPQAGILAAGAVEPRVVEYDGEPVVRPRMSAVLTADHRIVYGADAAAFLAAMRGALEHPAELAGAFDDPPEAS